MALKISVVERGTAVQCEGRGEERFDVLPVLDLLKTRAERVTMCMTEEGAALCWEAGER